MEKSSPPATSPPPPSAPPTSPVAQANPKQALLHVWPVLVSCSLNALLHSLGQLPQLLDLPQVLVSLLALFLGIRCQGHSIMMENTLTSGPHPSGMWFKWAAEAGAQTTSANSVHPRCSHIPHYKYTSACERP